MMTGAEQRVLFVACGVQLAVALCSILIRQEPQIVMYTTTLVMSAPGNATAVRGKEEIADVDVFTQVVGASPFALVASLSVVMFAAMTHQLHDQQLLDNTVEYSDLVLQEQASMWNGMTWLMVAASHAAVLMCLLSPVQTYLLLLALALAVVGICGLCQPGVRGGRTFATALYCASMLMVYSNLPQQHGQRLASFALLVFSDALLPMGHLYDPHPNMLTVANCRLAHAVSSCLAVLMAYGVVI